MPDMPLDMLPDGSVYESWEAPLTFSRTLVVDANAEDADDDNEGTAERPFRTITAAAARVQPGERVRIHTGTYRECIRPARGGDGPTAMVSFEAAGDGPVIVTGSEVVDGPYPQSTTWRRHDEPAARTEWGTTWQPSTSWRRPPQAPDAAVYTAHLPREWFVGINPFTVPNRAVSNLLGGFNQNKAQQPQLYMQRCGMLFQDDRRLVQVNDYSELFEGPGRFWPDPAGLLLHVRPIGDSDPTRSRFEATARSQCFAPDVEGLGYIRLKGLTFTRAANPFPFMPQDGAVSANRGHHWIIEDCTVEQVNAVGIEAGRRDARMSPHEPGGFHIIRRNHLRECGVCGIAGLGMVNSLIEDNLVEDCCWHDVEEMFESAGIKTHRNEGTLVRRNVVRRLAHGCGIWLDFANHNTRCSGNLIAEVHTRFGGIFIEASHDPVRVDQNIICHIHPDPGAVPSARGGPEAGGHGIYAHDNDFLEIDHNLIAHTAGSAVHLPRGRPDRFVEGRGSCSRHHTVVHNLFIATSRYVSFFNGDNHCDANAFAGPPDPGPFRLLRDDEWLDLDAWQRFYGFEAHGGTVTAEVGLDVDAMILQLNLPEGLPAHDPQLDPQRDWFSRLRAPDAFPPGPFAHPPAPGEAWPIDPRQPRSEQEG